MPGQETTDLVGRRLGHYRVDGVIGRGGMSTMYRATDVRLGRTVALKVMAEELAGDAEFRERFVDEARNTSAIDHSHIVPLYDFGDLDGSLFLAMRYVEGQDLAAVLAGGPLAPRRTVNLLSQVAEALDVLHARKLVHLDVKPANVLVTKRESAGREHVYLADFGLTRRGAAGHRTSNGDFLGSPTYAAPEHLRGEHVDGRTDVYSLACVLFACLTGSAPFRGSVDEVIAGHLSGAVPPVSAEAVLPRQLDEVVWRGMAAEPSARPDTCGELMVLAQQALAHVVQPESPPARRVVGAGAAAPAHPSVPPRGTSAPQGAAQPPAHISTLRLRDPSPTRAGSPLVAEPVTEKRWVIPSLVAVALAGLVLLVIGLVALAT
ncbi:serine/threonine-protein kinase [Rhodococcus sp. X156]|uniref:serine/threonine-protein kinase n=1 Tax=Rhodococcus sp. X156 TaxID=2499145 RepID=UPI0019D2D4D5|nr:serine/threonine-protein kinase [Rhodococcus sp. X156]